jgi:hypothetical protein
LKRERTGDHPKRLRANPEEQAVAILEDSEDRLKVAADRSAATEA